MNFSHHAATVVTIRATPPELFAFLDDPARLGQHMQRGSAMMMGGRMIYELDGARGRGLGAVIRMRGRVLALPLEVEEVITAYVPPTQKAWTTRAPTRLLIIGDYCMGFEIEAMRESSRLRVFIDYNLPTPGLGRLLGTMLAPRYARWCIARIAEDAARRFPMP